MKILHVHDFFAPGNSRYSHDLMRRLVERGHEVHVLAGVGPLGPPGDAVVDGVRFHTHPYGQDLPPARRLRHLLAASRRGFERLRRGWRPDVLVFNQPLCALALEGVRGACGISSVYWFISPWPGEYRAARGTTPRTWFPVASRRWLEDRAVRRSRVVLVESRYIARELRVWHPRVLARRIRIIPATVDPAVFHPPADREALRHRFGAEGRRVLFTLRRLVPRMGIDLLLRALALRPDPRAVLWVGGEGPQRPRLEALARSLGVAAKFLGYVPDGELPDRYGAADLFVLPTRVLEGFGLVLLEALACGTPVVATRVGAIPEVVDGIGGAVLAEPQPESLAAAIAGAPRSVDRSAVLQRYAWPRIVPLLEQALLEAARG